MPKLSVKLAESDRELQAVRALCLEWLEWHWRNYPPDWPVGEGHPMDRERFKTVLADLPQIHKRPLGAILLAYLDGVPSGCVMYAQARPGVAEFNRMYVSKAGRGHGIGRLLLDHMFGQMRADGYEKTVFSSAIFLTHARAMYEKAGFTPIPPSPDVPDAWRDLVYFMERSLRP